MFKTQIDPNLLQPYHNYFDGPVKLFSNLNLIFRYLNKTVGDNFEYLFAQ